MGEFFSKLFDVLFGFQGKREDSGHENKVFFPTSIVVPLLVFQGKWMGVAIGTTGEIFTPVQFVFREEGNTPKVFFGEVLFFDGIEWQMKLLCSFFGQSVHGVEVGTGIEDDHESRLHFFIDSFGIGWWGF